MICQLSIVLEHVIFKLFTKSIFDNISVHDQGHGAHHDPELAVADLPVPVFVHRLNHLFDFAKFYLRVKLLFGTWA